MDMRIKMAEKIDWVLVFDKAHLVRYMVFGIIAWHQKVRIVIKFKDIT